MTNTCSAQLERFGSFVRGPRIYTLVPEIFVSTKDGSKPLSKNVLSFLLREMIQQSHQQLARDHFPLLRVQACEIRGIAMSLNMWRNKSLLAVLEAASWKTPSVFANHYLSDVERVDGDIFSLGLIVTWGDVVA